MDYVNNLINSKPDPGLFGGKCSNLIHLISFGINVPPGFIVNTNAYKKFHEASELSEEIQNLLSNNYNPKDVIKISSKIENIYQKTSIPLEIVNEIKTAFNETCELLGGKISFSVRSSANIEDSIKFSFAGQAESFLNINSFDEILEGIKKCWISLYSPNALLYFLHLRKANLNISLLDLRMAVIIQKMLKSHISGVLFTVNVINNAKTEMLINSTWGIGDTITSNLVIPDMIILNRDKFSIKKCVIGDKEKTSVFNPEGSSTILEPTQQRLRSKSSLDASQLIKLFKLGLKIEEIFSYPQDIEWAIEGNKIYILQSRPITTLRE